MVTLSWNPSIWEVEAGEAKALSHLQLRSKFEASLGYMRLCLKRKVYYCSHIAKIYGKNRIQVVNSQ